MDNNTCFGQGWHGVVIEHHSSNNLITNNKCYNNGWYGISIGHYSDNNKVENNTCLNNKAGITVHDYSFSNSIKNNVCFYNLWQGISFIYIGSRFYKLNLVIGLNKRISFLSLLLSMCFFGTNIFSYYRYYILSAGFWDYILFIEAIILIIYVLIYNKYINLLLFIPLSWILFSSHKQELWFLVIVLIHLPFSYFFITNKNLKKIFKYLSIIYIVCLILTLIF